MQNTPFKAFHINAHQDDFKGNDGIGRYIFLPGSDGRAKQIAQHFEQVTVKEHARGHHLYLGKLSHQDKTIDVAAISSGMGCPSMEIILHELFHLGAKRFLRVGTAGSLQPHVQLGDFVNAQASVRDEQTTSDYVSITIPAIASLEFNAAILDSAKKLGCLEKVYTGIVHCKSSLYAREWGAGPNAAHNKAFVNLLSEYGVLATEMETAALFIQSQLYNHQLRQQGKGPHARVLCGAILGILAIPPHRFASSSQETDVIKNMIAIALESVKTLWGNERYL